MTYTRISKNIFDQMKSDFSLFNEASESSQSFYRLLYDKAMGIILDPKNYDYRSHAKEVENDNINSTVELINQLMEMSRKTEFNDNLNELYSVVFWGIIEPFFSCHTEENVHPLGFLIGCSSFWFMKNEAMNELKILKKIADLRQYLETEIDNKIFKFGYRYFENN